MYAFFITPIFSNSIESIILSIDPIGNTAYYLNPYLPSLQQDKHVFDIRVNEEIGLSLSTFIFDFEESPVTLYDSLRTRSAFHFIKGDYGFRDLSVKTQSLTLNGGTITGFAHTRSYEGVNVLLGEGSLMQNYLLNYRNNFKNSEFSITTAYHNEDLNIPISIADFSTKVNESYFSGLYLSHHTKFGNFDYRTDLQISETEIDNIDSEYWIHTQEAEFKFNAMGRFTPFLKWSQNEIQNFHRGGVTFRDSLIYLKINIANAFEPIIELKFNATFRNSYIQLERRLMDDYSDLNNDYVLNSLTYGLSVNQFNFLLSPSFISLGEDSYYSYSLGVGYVNEILSINTGGRFYHNNEWGLKYFNSSEIQLNFPYFERYTPYLKIVYDYYYFEAPKNAVSPLNSTSFIEVDFDDMNKAVHRLNFEFGFNLEAFKISYHYKNVLGEDGRFTNNYEQVPMHKYLKVEWQFRN